MLTNSKNNPEKDPVIFWYNGGPGCSSLLGLFTELGPYLLNKDGSKLIENPHSWNNNASVVLLNHLLGLDFLMQQMEMLPQMIILLLMIII
uniref:Uncharacterized protein n=1 Tax=Meloidogyne enterolobii TaxID=390850 RepID=A0A6V7W9C8_MELEN|nr:unnamed protein product [Meloidogyne enterolobii]